MHIHFIDSFAVMVADMICIVQPYGKDRRKHTLEHGILLFLLTIRAWGIHFNHAAYSRYDGFLKP